MVDRTSRYPGRQADVLRLPTWTWRARASRCITPARQSFENGIYFTGSGCCDHPLRAVIVCKPPRRRHPARLRCGMDEWNPMLSQRVAETEDRHAEVRERVNAAIIGLVVALGLVGWLLSL